MNTKDNNGTGMITLRSLIIGVLLSGFFAWVTVILDNIAPASRGYFISGNLLPVLPHLFLLLAAVAVNPFLKRVKIARLFNKSEILLVFVMCALSAGIASWGLTGQLVPGVSALSNRSWNNDQASWDVYAMPVLNENYFVSEKGTQTAAQKLRDVHLDFEKSRSIYQAARDLELGKYNLAQAEEKMKELSTKSALPSAEAAIQEKMILWSHTQSSQLLTLAGEKWDEIGEGQDPAAVTAAYPEKIEKLKLERDRLRAELKELNKQAFDAVDEYRKGLPAEKRATPGFFYSPGEGAAGYAGRIKRFREGTKSRKILESAATELTALIATGGVLPDGWQGRINEANDILESISDIPQLSRKHEQLAADLKTMEDEIADLKSEGRKLRDLRRYSSQSEFESFNSRISEIDALAEKKQAKADKLRLKIENQLEPLLEVCGRVKAAKTALEGISASAADSNTAAYPALLNSLQSVIATYPSFDASARRFWLGDAKWQMWLRPLFNWIALAFVGYAVLISFNVLIFRQWAHNEKLIYPLAEAATILSGTSDSEGDGKSIYRSGLFWTGFSIALGVLGWNYLATNNIVPNIEKIELQFLWNRYVGSGLFRGWGSTYFCIIFVVIGVSFLVPANISFSLWFFEFLYMCLLLVMVWLGYGNDRWSLGNVGRSGIGSGAMLVFGLTILWTCRRYLLCIFRPGEVKALSSDEARELRVCSALFLVSSLVLVLMLSFGLGASLFFVTVYFLLVLTMAIALIRAVAEGGVLGIESSASLAAIMKALFGVNSIFVPAMLAPAAVYWGLFFGGTKAFIGPMIANSLKVREHIGIRHLQFHGAIWAGIVAAVLVSVMTLIIISYDRGADNLHGWLNSATASGAINGVKGAMLDTAPLAASERWWMITGAVLMSGLLFARRRIFGIPHPIGLLMIMNSNMLGFWGSILIGWTFKSIVSKYCSHEQYVSIRRFFIGLIAGHMIAVLLGWDHLFFHWG